MEDANNARGQAGPRRSRSAGLVILRWWATRQPQRAVGWQWASHMGRSPGAVTSAAWGRSP